MAHIEYQVKMLRLEYDPIDRDVRTSIELPLEDAPLTERQFNRCLERLASAVDGIESRAASFSETKVAIAVFLY